MTFKKDGKNNLAICPCRDCTGGSDGQISNFYSFEHAKEFGWHFTKSITFCDQNNKDGVWVCPECSQGYFET